MVVLHTDVCGPMKVESLGRSLYLIEFMDDKSLWCEVPFIRMKGGIYYISPDENQKSISVKCFHSDNGKELVNRDFKEYLKGREMARRLTVLYNPAPERYGGTQKSHTPRHGTMSAHGFSVFTIFMGWSGKYSELYTESVSFKGFERKAPYEAWTGNTPNLSHLHLFGCKVIYFE